MSLTPLLRMATSSTRARAVTILPRTEMHRVLFDAIRTRGNVYVLGEVVGEVHRRR